MTTNSAPQTPNSRRTRVPSDRTRADAAAQLNHRAPLPRSARSHQTSPSRGPANMNFPLRALTAAPPQFFSVPDDESGLGIMSKSHADTSAIDPGTDHHVSVKAASGWTMSIAPNGTRDCYSPARRAQRQGLIQRACPKGSKLASGMGEPGSHRRPRRMGSACPGRNSTVARKTTGRLGEAGRTPSQLFLTPGHPAPDNQMTNFGQFDDLLQLVVESHRDVPCLVTGCLRRPPRCPSPVRDDGAWSFSPATSPRKRAGECSCGPSATNVGVGVG